MANAQETASQFEVQLRELQALQEEAEAREAEVASALVEAQVHRTNLQCWSLSAVSHF